MTVIRVPEELCTVDRLGGADDCDACVVGCEQECVNYSVQKCFDRIAAYENTGLTP